MSWDIFVQDIPLEASTVDDIPADFSPRPIGRRSEIIQKIKEAAPGADFTDPSWGVIEGNDYSIEVNLGRDEEITSFAFHVRGSEKAVSIISEILRHLKMRALDSGTGEIFNDDRARASYEGWRRYRDQIIDG